MVNNLLILTANAAAAFFWASKYPLLSKAHLFVAGFLGATLLYNYLKGR